MARQEVTKRLLVKKMVDPENKLYCSVIATLKLFATKWKPCILCYLLETPMRYNDLYRIIPNISRKMLSLHLKEMEEDGLIVRVQYDYKLQRVEYSLTEKGKSLFPILEHLQNWGLSNLKGVVSMREMVEATTRQSAVAIAL